MPKQPQRTLQFLHSPPCYASTPKITSPSCSVRAPEATACTKSQHQQLISGKQTSPLSLQTPNSKPITVPLCHHDVMHEATTKRCCKYPAELFVELQHKPMRRMWIEHTTEKVPSKHCNKCQPSSKDNNNTNKPANIYKSRHRPTKFGTTRGPGRIDPPAETLNKHATKNS
jgi:hypothetical protein